MAPKAVLAAAADETDLLLVLTGALMSCCLQLAMESPIDGISSYFDSSPLEGIGVSLFLSYKVKVRLYVVNI